VRAPHGVVRRHLLAFGHHVHNRHLDVRESRRIST
jgi:hypothetical protein